MANCPACGKEYSPPSAFCPNCGALLDKPDTRSAEQPVSQKVQTLPIISDSGEELAQFGDVGIYIVRRFLALVVDLAGVGLLIAIGLLALLERAKMSIQPQTPDGLRSFAIIVTIALFLYFWVFEALFGATLGKLLFGLEVRRSGGGRVGFWRALVRNVLRIIDLAVVGFVLATVTPRRQRIGDFAAGSVVPSHRMGALAPVVAVIVLGGIGYLSFAYGDAMRHARDLYDSSQQYAPQLLGGSTSPAPTPAATATSSPAVATSPTVGSSPTASTTPTLAPSPAAP